MNGIFLPQIVLIDQRHCILIIFRKLAFSWGFLFLLHEVDAKQDAAVSAHHIVEMFACSYAHVVATRTN